jgi:GNAT superfamily N-acetyltransferase
VSAAVVIREYREADEAALIGLVGELQEVELGWIPIMRPAAEIGPWYVADLLAQCERDGGTILIAEQAGRVIGYATIYLGLTTAGDRDVVELRYGRIGDLAVTQTKRGEGVGRALVIECEARARRAGIRHLTIGAVAANETARRLYESLGFTVRHVELDKDLS